MNSRAWIKLGLLYCPSAQNRHPKLLSHAANPLPIHLKDDIYRIFFSGRDINNRSSIGAVDVDLVKQTIIHEYLEPFFQHGPIGSFYADGLSIGNCYQVNGVRYMLFMGWQNNKNDHWRGDIGRLIVRPDLSLQLDPNDVYLGVDSTDPISLSYPWVMDRPGGDHIMWYGSTITWDAGNAEMLHVINYATSKDGQHWERKGIAVPFEIGQAQAFSRPTVAYSEIGGYEMWFSYRGGAHQKYRIGKAVSPNGIKWELALETAGIDVSPNGWDSEMIEYPFLLTHKNKTYLLYNGNGYGKTGFGIAVLNDYNSNTPMPY